MPLPLRLTLGSLLVLAGVALLAVAVSGSRSRLPRNRFVGVRTDATLRSDAAFALANRVAAAPMAAAGGVAAAGGAILLVGAEAVLSWVVLAVSVAGMLVLAGVAGVAGDRAARAVESHPPVGAVCAGTCVGCDLVAGCRPVAGGGARSPAPAPGAAPAPDEAAPGPGGSPAQAAASGEQAPRRG